MAKSKDLMLALDILQPVYVIYNVANERIGHVSVSERRTLGL